MATHPAFVGMLINSCSIRPSENDFDSLKNPIVTYGDPVSNIACRRVPLSGSTEHAVAATMYDAETMFYMLPAVVVKKGDLLAEGGVDYLVMGVEMPQDDEGTHHQEVFCKSQKL